MSVDITIEQKGFIKKELPFDAIVGGGLRFGFFEGLRLAHDQINDAGFAAYHPAHIGRGFSVEWKKGEKSKVGLHLQIPASNEDVDDFYDAVERIIEVWKNSVITQDGAAITRADIPAMRGNIKSFSLNSLHDMCSGADPLTIFCAYWPLALTKEEMERFANAESLDGLRDYMHEKQSLDAYYAVPKFYQVGTGGVGLYAFTEDTRSILPKAPYVPFGTNNSQTGGPVEVGRWFVNLFSISKGGTLAQVPYDDFIRNAGRQSEYDNAHVVIENMSLAEMESLAERFGTKVE